MMRYFLTKLMTSIFSPRADLPLENPWKNYIDTQKEYEKTLNADLLAKIEFIESEIGIKFVVEKKG